ncbi:MAG: ABC-2 family transporter protein [Alphaproteobacteria bacterium]|nr:ABC-2 family transporter protein [Alphaproteobacteria bacterium]MBV8548242.1 ABC-2 family transporter protein [Alphaproteobacteria bacterium]
MEHLATHLHYIGTLIGINMRAHHGDVKRTVSLGLAMLFQNLMFFTLWVIFFHTVQQVKGWQLADLGLMYGTVATAVGLTIFMADGVRTIGTKIQNGSIDGLLARPRHALLPLILSRSNSASLGDILSGPIYWFLFGHATASQIPLLLVITVMASSIFLSSLVIFYSMPFWVSNSQRFPDQMFDILIIFCSIPQHAQTDAVKVVMFSLLPAGFISLIPVGLLHQFDARMLALMMAATLFYGVLAVIIFNAGVRRYVQARG